MNSNVCLNTLTEQTAKYLSNIYDTNYAFDNFYTSITINPPATLEGNNTGENYYNSSFIDLTTLTQEYVYVLSLNQNLMKTALTSNIQIYNKANNQPVNKIINTSGGLPQFSNKNYPYAANNNKMYPLFQLNGYNVQEFISANITSILIVERLSYNPINFYQSSYDYTGSAYILFGSELSNANTDYLNSNYDITINYN